MGSISKLPEEIPEWVNKKPYLKTLEQVNIYWENLNWAMTMEMEGEADGTTTSAAAADSDIETKRASGWTNPSPSSSIPEEGGGDGAIIEVGGTGSEPAEKKRFSIGERHGRKLYSSLAVYDLVADDRYLIIGFIGKGSFGELYRGLDLTNWKMVAFKVETYDRKEKQLYLEKKIFRALGPHPDGFPYCYWFGEERDYMGIVMDYLGPSLIQLASFCGGTLDLKSVLLLGEQLILRLALLHRKGFIHRDIKPGNIVMGMHHNAWKVYLVDFGLSRQYRKNGVHRYDHQDSDSFAGTARYASINAMKGFGQSRRDDVESLIYSLIYLLKGNLPWERVTASTKKQKQEKILEMKQNTSPKELCRGVPEVFEDLLVYCRSLNYSDTPDYEYVRRCLDSERGFRMYQKDYKYDWIVKYCYWKKYGGLEARLAHADAEHPQSAFSENFKIHAESSELFKRVEKEQKPPKKPWKCNGFHRCFYGDVPCIFDLDSDEEDGIEYHYHL